MTEYPALLDSDTLSELSRGHPRILVRAAEYLARHGRLALSAVSVFERLRGYRAAIRAGRPFESQLRQFEMLAGSSLVLPVDARVADTAATIWASLPAHRRQATADILIAATACTHRLPLVTRNRRDFDPIGRVEGVALSLLDWSRA